MLTAFDVAELEPLPPRPRTRGDCVEGVRPCPWVGCRHHLFLDVSQKTGRIRYHHDLKEPWELSESCSLDVADRGGEKLRTVGVIIGGVSREAVRLIEAEALVKLATPRMREFRGDGHEVRTRANADRFFVGAVPPVGADPDRRHAVRRMRGALRELRAINAERRKARP